MDQKEIIAAYAQRPLRKSEERLLRFRVLYLCSICVVVDARIARTVRALFEDYSAALETQVGKLGILNRQKEACKDAVVFVCNRMSHWEAGTRGGVELV